MPMPGRGKSKKVVEPYENPFALEGRFFGYIRFFLQLSAGPEIGFFCLVFGTVGPMSGPLSRIDFSESHREPSLRDAADGPVP
jgi:hypothetical protein